MVDQTQVPTLLRHLSGAGQVRRLVVQVSGQDFPVVDYLVSAPSSDVQGRIVDPSNHLTLVPSGHPGGERAQVSVDDRFWAIQ